MVAAPAIAIANINFAANGFGYGLRQSFLRTVIKTDLREVTDWTAVDRLLTTLLPDAEVMAEEENDEAGQALVRRILHWTRMLQRSAGHPIFEEGKVLQSRSDGRAWQLAVPAQDHVAGIRALRLVCEVISRGIDKSTAAATPDAARHRADAVAFAQECPAKGFSGSNTLHFLKAAHDAWYPWIALAGGVYQVGAGSRSRWLDSSLTDQTSAIATKLARNKISTAHVLRQAGIPVPDHVQVKSVEDAVRVADQLGYPVVVKPADRDGGLGVAAGIKDPNGVMRAFEAARMISDVVIVERHVEGRDYRLVIFGGQLIWALERVPGGITGDGVHTIRELVDRLNADSRRSKASSAPLKPLHLNDEAAELISEAGMSTETVLDDGQWLRLRRAANVASGGTPVGVFEKVHPANRLLAERAARALRLDIAGVDLLIPDIERSWAETGAAVCEINAQPTIGTTTSAHLYRQVLDGLFPSGARIPIGVIVGLPASSTVVPLLERILEACGSRLGVASARSAHIARELVVPKPASLFMSARTLLADTSVDAMLVLIDDGTPLDSLLPFDLCSVLALGGDTVNGGRNALANLARMIVPMSARLVVDASAHESMALARGVSGIPITVAQAGAGDASAIGGAQEVSAQLHGHELTLHWKEGDVYTFPLGGGGIDCAPGDVALAAAVAAGLGCPLTHLPAVLSQALAASSSGIPGVAG